MEQNTNTNIDVPAQQGVETTINGSGFKDLAKAGVVLGAATAAGAAAVVAVGDGLIRLGGWIIRKAKDGVEKHRENKAAKKAAKEGGSK